MKIAVFTLLLATLAFTACSTTPKNNEPVFDVLIRGGQRL